jgi:hypothetical protein
MPYIDRIFVACTKDDQALTRICVASIRHWYPDLPIALLKDENYGAFSTAELERVWNVSVWPTTTRVFGWGFSKLEPLFDVKAGRFLMLDSDIVIVGRVVEALERFDADFVVQEEVQPPEQVDLLYFRPAEVRERIDAAFPHPAFTFNSGQFVATGGKLARSDFDDILEWSSPRRHRFPGVFNPSDPGALNCVVLRRLAAGTLSVARTPFMKWGFAEVADIDVARLDVNSPYPYVIHWAGLKHRHLGRMIRADILRYFEAMHYARVPFGGPRRLARAARDELTYHGRRARRLGSRIVRAVLS